MPINWLFLKECYSIEKKMLEFIVLFIEFTKRKLQDRELFIIKAYSKYHHENSNRQKCHWRCRYSFLTPKPSKFNKQIIATRFVFLHTKPLKQMCRNWSNLLGYTECSSVYSKAVTQLGSVKINEAQFLCRSDRHVSMKSPVRPPYLQKSLVLILLSKVVTTRALIALKKCFQLVFTLQSVIKYWYRKWWKQYSSFSVIFENRKQSENNMSIVIKNRKHILKPREALRIWNWLNWGKIDFL